MTLGLWYNVPETTVTLTSDQEMSLQEARDAIFNLGDGDGIIAYQVVLQIASARVRQ